MNTFTAQRAHAHADATSGQEEAFPSEHFSDVDQ
jgi:hypothetical protein